MLLLISTPIVGSCYCSMFCALLYSLHHLYFIINYLFPSFDQFIASVRRSLSPHYDCPFDLPSMTPGERVIMSGTTIIAQIYMSLSNSFSKMATV